MKKLRVALLGAVVAALVVTSSAAAFTPTNTYYAKQWYLSHDNAFDAWPTPPTLDSVKVAIVDSGVDCSLPDFLGQIAKSKSFVGGSACFDSQGHGTIVAGEIAGALDQAGVVGLAYSSQLLVAKVVAADGSIPLKAEAAASAGPSTRAHGSSTSASARSGTRPIQRSTRTRRSRPQAVAYAVRKGAVVVAAVGNSDEAYTTPWPYASWPCRAAARHRRRRADPLRRCSGLLGPGSDLRRPRRAGRRHLLHLPEDADRRPVGLQAPGLHRLRDGRLPPSRGHVVRGAAGVGGRGGPLRRRPVAHEQPGHEDPRADTRTTSAPRTTATPVPDGARQVQRLGSPRRDEGRRFPELPASAVRPSRAERQALAGAQALGEARRPRRDARLLGRPRRRLPGAPRPRPAAARAGDGAVGARVSRPEPVATGDDDRLSQARRGRAAGASGEDTASLVPRARAAAGTTSSCARGTAAAVTRCT